MSTPSVKNGALQFRTIRDLRELETLRAIWKSWPGTRDSDLDFFSSAVRSRGSGCRPHVIVLARNGRPDAILVGLRERKKIPVNWGRIIVGRPQANVLEFVYGGLRGNACDENCVALLQRVVRSLDQGEADLALWEQLDVQSPLYSCVLQLQRFALRDHFRCHDDRDRWLMNFPEDLDAFLSNLCRDQRSKLRRKYKKVLNRFADRMQVRHFRSVADLEPAISAMEEIASKSAKRQVGFGFFDTPRIRDQMAIAAEGGWLRIYVLYLEHKPAAFWMGTLYDRCLQADDVGYDPAWSEFSPGIVLFLNILEDLRDADIEIVDFGRGSSQLKQCFAAFRRVESRVHIYASTPRGIQLSLLSAVTHRATSLIRSTHCLAWVRRSL
jgi:CelD/BcsL family acetyltransferase involved in cellulose biosynthesis